MLVENTDTTTAQILKICVKCGLAATLFVGLVLGYLHFPASLGEAIMGQGSSMWAGFVYCILLFPQWLVVCICGVHLWLNCVSWTLRVKGIRNNFSHRLHEFKITSEIFCLILIAGAMYKAGPETFKGMGVTVFILFLVPRTLRAIYNLDSKYPR